MAKKSSILKVRKPAIRIGKKGVSVTNFGASIGGKKARINLSRKGVSATVGTAGASYNTRRGCFLSPLTILSNLFSKRR